MNQKILYSVEDLTKFIIKQYELPISNDDDISTYMQRVYRALHQSKIWDNGIVSKNKQRYFSEEQKQRLLLEKSLYDYLRKNSSSKTINEKPSYADVQKEINRRREERIELLDNLSEGRESSEYDNPCISNKEYQYWKNNIMLTALFEQIFTPINKELLEMDLNRVEFTLDELNLEHEDIETLARLLHPEGFYYKKRTND